MNDFWSRVEFGTSRTGRILGMLLDLCTNWVREIVSVRILYRRNSWTDFDEITVYTKKYKFGCVSDFTAALPKTNFSGFLKMGSSYKKLG
jgi:hypothetical protein